MNTARLDALLDHFVRMDRGPAGCALSVSLGGKGVYEGYFGYADVESGRKIAPETVYRQYSSSKVVTAVAMMILLERGLYQLDDPISAYLPEFSGARYVEYTGNNMNGVYPVRSLTVKHFLTMTSGLTYDGGSTTTQAEVRRALEELNGRGGYTARDFSRRIAQVPLAFEPGAHWNYGVNLDVLGAFIEVVSGRPFGRFLREEIFDPLGMADTTFFLDDAKRGRLAAMYRFGEGGERVRNASDDFKYEEAFAFECGGGGLLSTLGDTARFARMLSMGGALEGVRILGRKTIDLMRQNHLGPGALSDFQRTHRSGWEFMSGYGYGLGVKTLMNLAESNCAGSPGEFSWAGAAGTLTLVDPAERLALVYMQQLMPGNREGYCHPRLRNVVYGLLE